MWFLKIIETDTGVKAKRAKKTTIIFIQVKEQGVKLAINSQQLIYFVEIRITRSMLLKKNGWKFESKTPCYCDYKNEMTHI